jgi:hypothetical protein
LTSNFLLSSKVLLESYEEAFQLLSTGDRPLVLSFLSWDEQLEEDIPPLQRPFCAVCLLDFGILKWRYHCKLCGNSVCSHRICSINLSAEVLGSRRSSTVRFCDFCVVQCVTCQQEDPTVEMDLIVGGLQPQSVDATIVAEDAEIWAEMNYAEVLQEVVSPQAVLRTSPVDIDPVVVVNAVPVQESREVRPIQLDLAAADIATRAVDEERLVHEGLGSGNVEGLSLVLVQAFTTYAFVVFLEHESPPLICLTPAAPTNNLLQSISLDSNDESEVEVEC